LACYSIKRGSYCEKVREEERERGRKVSEERKNE